MKLFNKTEQALILMLANGEKAVAHALSWIEVEAKDMSSHIFLLLTKGHLVREAPAVPVVAATATPVAPVTTTTIAVVEPPAAPVETTTAAPAAAPQTDSSEPVVVDSTDVAETLTQE
jgi:hypothetical protein